MKTPSTLMLMLVVYLASAQDVPYTPFSAVVINNSPENLQTFPIIQSLYPLSGYMHNYWYYDGTQGGFSDSVHFEFNNRHQRSVADFFSSDTNNQLYLYHHHAYTYDANQRLASYFLSFNQSVSSNITTRTLYTYNTAGNFTNILIQFWDTTSSQWKNMLLDTYAYDASNNLQQHISQMFDQTQNSWQNNSAEFFTYNQNDSILTDLREGWSNFFQQWEVQQLATNTYNNQNQLVKSVIQIANAPGDTLVNSYANQYAYDNAGNRIVNLILNWSFGINQWVNADSTFYTFDNNHNLLQSENFRYDTGTWTPFRKVMMQYNNLNQPVDYINQHHWNGYYKTDNHSIFLYNANNQIDTFIHYVEDGIIPNDITAYTFDSSGNVLTQLGKSLFNDSTYGNTDLYKYYYVPVITDGLKPELNQLNVTLYPNPTTADIFLSLKLEQPTHLSINIYEVNGRIVSTENRNATAGENKIQLNYPGMSKDSYIVQVIDLSSGKSSSLKFVKQ